jgi:hypothetical protein
MLRRTMLIQEQLPSAMRASNTYLLPDDFYPMTCHPEPWRSHGEGPYDGKQYR